MQKILARILRFEKIKEINAHYRGGKVTMTPLGRIVLSILKIYLFVMIVLLLVKFVQIMAGGRL